MSSIFISYDSCDRDVATRIYDALVSRDYESPFLDYHPDAGIEVGTEWRPELFEYLRNCKAMIVLVSEEWCDSKWCFAEYVFAKTNGKAVFPILVRKFANIPPIIAQTQVLDIAGQVAADSLTTPYELGPLWKAFERRGIHPHDDLVRWRTWYRQNQSEIERPLALGGGLRGPRLWEAAPWLKSRIKELEPKEIRLIRRGIVVAWTARFAVVALVAVLALLSIWGFTERRKAQEAATTAEEAEADARANAATAEVAREEAAVSERTLVEEIATGYRQRGDHSLRAKDMLTGQLMYAEGLSVLDRKDSINFFFKSREDLRNLLFEARFASPSLQSSFKVSKYCEWLAFAHGTDTLLAAAGSDVTIWTVNTGRRRRGFSVASPDSEDTSQVFARFPTSYALNASSDLLAVGYGDGTTCVWRTENGELLHTLPCSRIGSRQSISSLAFARSGRLVTGSLDGTVLCWNADYSDKNEFHVQYGVDCVAISPDENWVSAGGVFGHAQVWSLSDEKHTHIPDDGVSAVAFTASSLLVTANKSGVITTWHTDSPKHEDQFVGHTIAAHTLSVLPLRGLLVSGSNDNTVRIWNPKTDGLQLMLRGQGSDFALNSDGSQIATLSSDGEINVWDLPPKGYRLDSGSPVVAMDFSRGEHRLCVGHIDGTVSQWKIGKESFQKVFITNKVEGGVTAIDASANALIATGHDDGVIKLWNATTGDLRRTIQIKDPFGDPAGGRTNSLALDADSRWLATAHSETSEVPELWLFHFDEKLDDTQLPESRGTSFGTAECIDLDESGEWVVWLDKHGGIGRMSRKAQKHRMSRVNAGSETTELLCAGPNRMATGDNRGNVSLWRIADGKRSDRILSAGQAIADLDYCASKDLLVCGTRYKANGADQPNEGLVVVWEVGTGRQLLRFAPLDGDVENVAISDDARWLAVSGANGSISVWYLPDLLAARDSSAKALLWAARRDNGQ